MAIFILLHGAFAQISADFSANKINGCAPFSVKFVPQTNDNTLNYRWNFGNGNLSTDIAPEAIYYVPGKYDISLVITDKNGNTYREVKSQFIHVFKDPEANFSFQVAQLCRPVEVTLKNETKLGDGPIVEFIWDFGDGNLSNAPNPTHIYQGFGNMTLNLYVKDSNGCVSNISKQNAIKVERSPIPKIRSDEPFACKTPHTFNLESISELGGPNDKYEWFFRDGGKASGQNVSHTVSKNGYQDVILKITTPGGCVSVDTFGNFLFIGKPYPDFEVSERNICQGNKITFINKTIPLFGRFEWHMGDGQVINGLNPTVSFNQVGRFSPKLIVRWSDDCVDSFSRNNLIDVSPNPDVDLEVEPFEPCPLPFDLIVNNKSNANLQSAWFVDDLEIVPQTRDFFRTIDQYQVLNLKLVVTNSYRCKADTTVVIKIKPPSVKLFSDIKEGCAPLEVNFSYFSDMESAKNIKFDFDHDSSLNFKKNPEILAHTFQDTGRFKVSVTIETEGGCIITDTLEIRVGMKTEPDFSLADSFCNGDVLFLKNLTSLNHPYLEYLTWSINGTLVRVFAQDTNSIMYDHPLKGSPDYQEKLNREEGFYDVELVTVHNGCKDTIRKDSVFFVSYPLTKIGGSQNPCDTMRILTNNSKGYHRHEWEITSSSGVKISYADSIIVRRGDGIRSVKLTTWNDSTGCKHEKEMEIRWFGNFDAKINWDFSLCAPGMVDVTIFPIPFQPIRPKMFINGEEYPFRPSSLKGPGVKKIEIEITNLNGCILKFDTTVTVIGESLDGVVLQDSGCTPIPVVLRSIYNPLAFRSVHWLLDGRKVNLSDSGTVNDTLFSAGNKFPQNELIQLIGMDTLGCEIARSFKAVADGMTDLAIKVRKYNECDRRTFNFEAFAPNVDLTPYQVHWDFGNGKTGSNLNHVVIYDKEGEYVIKLTLTEPNGCATTIEHLLNLKEEKLMADFDIKMTQAKCPPVFVEFKNNSLALSRNIKKVLWDFGDGSFSDVYNPQKIYLKSGDFTIKLYIEDIFGCKDSIIKKNVVNIQGPLGEGGGDTSFGCVPLTVNFTSTIKNASEFEWDLGDGTVIKDINNLTHTYTRPGIFIPVLVMRDSTDCRYVLPLDTIIVQDAPKPIFQQKGICQNQPIELVAKNLNEDVNEYTIQWTITDFNNTFTASKDTVQYRFNSKNPRVSLAMTTPYGCTGTMEKNLNLSTISANFKSAATANCVGGLLELNNTSQSDAPITDFYWIINGDLFYEKYPQYRTTKIGKIPITLIQQNSNGCKDSFFSEEIIIGDTFPPLIPEILRVTVVDDYSIQFDFKEEKSPDFKSYWIYREEANGFNNVGKLFNSGQVSFTEYNLNPLEEVYCYMLAQENACGLVSDTFSASSHCTIETKAIGERNRNRVTWNAYSGWADIEKYHIHRKTLKPGDSFKKLAEVPNDIFEYIDSLVVCKTIYAYLIEGIERNGNVQVSFSDTAVAQPFWDYIPPPNKLVRATVEDNKHILIEWDSVRNSQTQIVSYHLEKSSNGEDFRNIGDFSATKFDFLDKQVKVMERSYYYQVYAIDECDAKTPYWNYGKTILLVADSVGFQRPRLRFSTYQGWIEDVDYYMVEIDEPNLGFIEIGSTRRLDSTFIDEMSELNRRPNYCYRIIGHKEMVSGESKVVSVSNVDCSPVYSAINYPNAFSPNGDGINDTYGTPSFYIKDYHIQIFNRWGEMVFESFDIADKWDGEYMGKPAQQDAYAVIIHSVGVDLIKRTHFGTITLVR